MTRFACCLSLFLFASILVAQDQPERPAPRSSNLSEDQREEFLLRLHEQQQHQRRSSRQSPPSVYTEPGKQLHFSVFIVTVSSDVQFDQKHGYDLAEFEATLRQLREEGLATRTETYRLSTLENLPASIQIGKQEAVATGYSTGFSRTREGTPTRQLQFQQQNTGTIIQINSRIEKEGTVIVEMTAEQSLIEESTALADDDAEFVPPKTSTFSNRITTRVPNGRLMHIGGAKQTVGKTGVTQVLFLQAQHDAEKSE